MNSFLSNVSSKVKAQSATGVVTSFITWLLVSVFHTGLTPDVKALLTAGVGIVLGSAAGWLKREATNVNKAESVIARVEAAVSQVESLLGQLSNQSGTGGTVTSTRWTPHDLDVVQPPPHEPLV